MHEDLGLPRDITLYQSELLVDVEGAFIANQGEVAEAGRHMKVTVHDHIIIGSQGRSSLRALGLM